MPENASTLFLGDSALLWMSMRQHPVVRGLAAGTLPADQFDYWVQQNFHFVIGARRFLSLLIARTGEQDIVQRLGQGMLALGEELERLQQYARGRAVPLTVERAPTCEAYVNFLINSGVYSFEVGFTVLFAVERAHLDAWRVIRGAPASKTYQPWVELWTSPEFATYVNWIEATLNRHLAGYGASALEPLRRSFRLAGRYEYLFWEMVQKRETWPI